MRLESLDISGFKSFAKKTTLSFDVPITAIVGPNGSGKSNVAESLRFGLAEQSMKSMRGKRGEDLIFSGTNVAPRANRASVALTFNNKDRFFEHIDFDKVVLERVVYRDGANEYLINGSKVRLKDVQELLARANVGETGHHIISQGEADRVLSAHPRERRMMIEEALGLRYYQYKKDEAEKKLAKTEENIRQVGSLRREIAPHMKFLKSQVERVAKYGELKEKLIEEYKTFFAKEDAYVREEGNHIALEEQEPKRIIPELKKEVERLKERTLRDLSSEDTRTEQQALEKEVENARHKERSLTIEMGKVEGALLALGGSKESDGVAVPAGELQEIVAIVRNTKEEVNRTEDVRVVRGLVGNLLSSLEAFIHRYVESPHHTQKSVELRESLSSLEKEYAKASQYSRECENDLTAFRNKAMMASEDARRDERDLFEKRTVLAEQERILSIALGKKNALQERKVELEREKAEALALVGAKAFEYDTYTGKVHLHEQQESQRNLERMKIRVEEFGGASEEVLKEYQEIEARDAFLGRELEDLTNSSSSLNELISQLEKELSTIFNEGLTKINKTFNEYFGILFGGGSAKLAVVALGGAKNEEDEEEQEEEVEEGVDIAVVVPKKRVKGLTALSGGERALTSIALIFAMSSVNPPPFLILDETDAALDEANSRRYSMMLLELAKHSQLVVITHNRETMSSAGVLYGVTMGSDGVSNLLSVRFEEAVAVAK